MTLADPLDLGALIRVSDLKLVPVWTQKRSAAGGGVTIYADRAPMVWRLDVTSPPMRNADAEALMALCNTRAGGLRPILIHNPRLPYPGSDPGASTFGAATPLVGTIADRTHVAFTGFPAAYQIPAGTYFGVLFDASRYYLGQFGEARTADVMGAVASVEVAPALPDSVATGDAVTVATPSIKARIVPGSAYLAQVDTTLARLAFSAEQTYEA